MSGSGVADPLMSRNALTTPSAGSICAPVAKASPVGIAGGPTPDPVTVESGSRVVPSGLSTGADLFCEKSTDRTLAQMTVPNDSGGNLAPRLIDASIVIVPVAALSAGAPKRM